MPPKARQTELFHAQAKTAALRQHARRSEHGGEIASGRRKLARPFDPKRPLHLVLRAERARGQWSLLRTENRRVVNEILVRAARANGVRIHEQGNSGNHLHLLVRARSRSGFQNFTRTIGALIARAVTGAKKGNPVGKFWDELIYSRVVAWGRDFRRVANYVVINELEGLGVGSYRKRSGVAPHGAGLGRVWS